VERVDELREKRLGAVEQCERRQTRREECDGQPAVAGVARTIAGLNGDRGVHVFDRATRAAIRKMSISVVIDTLLV
jgi:hypothetical protein